jgi:hypothetical protein
MSTYGGTMQRLEGCLVLIALLIWGVREVSSETDHSLQCLVETQLSHCSLHDKPHRQSGTAMRLLRTYVAKHQSFRLLSRMETRGGSAQLR